jgi:hypothetical protein
VARDTELITCFIVRQFISCIWLPLRCRSEHRVNCNGNGHGLRGLLLKQISAPRSESHGELCLLLIVFITSSVTRELAVARRMGVPDKALQFFWANEHPGQSL